MCYIRNETIGLVVVNLLVNMRKERGGDTLTKTYSISVSLICHGGKPSGLCTPPKTSASSGSGNPLVAADVDKH